jgi:hypothetical protein
MTKVAKKGATISHSISLSTQERRKKRRKLMEESVCEENRRTRSSGECNILDNGRHLLYINNSVPCFGEMGQM